MNDRVKVGIIICHRYHNCAGGKCLRALRNREGAFSIYKDKEVELVGYTTCAGCPGGNIEYAPQEMKKNGAQVIHLATCLVVGYPPCIRTDYFSNYINKKFDMEVVIGTHPFPQNYYITHEKLGRWNDASCEKLKQVLLEEKDRLAYD